MFWDLLFKLGFVGPLNYYLVMLFVSGLVILPIIASLTYPGFFNGSSSLNVLFWALFYIDIIVFLSYPLKVNAYFFGVKFPFVCIVLFFECMWTFVESFIQNLSFSLTSFYEVFSFYEFPFFDLVSSYVITTDGQILECPFYFPIFFPWAEPIYELLAYFYAFFSFLLILFFFLIQLFFFLLCLLFFFILLYFLLKVLPGNYFMSFLNIFSSARATQLRNSNSLFSELFVVTFLTFLIISLSFTSFNYLYSFSFIIDSSFDISNIVFVEGCQWYWDYDCVFFIDFFDPFS